MRIEPLFYSLFIKDDVWVRVYVNDLPLYVEPPTKARSVSETFNEYLVPGKNSMSMQVLRSPIFTDGAPERRWTVQFDIYRQTDAHDVRKSIEDSPELESLFLRQFPDVYESVDEEHRRIPFFYRTTFDNPFDNQPEAVWQRAPTADFDGEGNRELRKAVEEVHGALKMQSPGAFVDAMSLKMEHDAASYASPVYDTDQRIQMQKFVEFGPIVDDLDFAELHFTRLHEGRVAHVTRLDNRYVFDVSTRRDKKIRLRMDLLLTQHEGRWRVFA